MRDVSSGLYAHHRRGTGVSRRLKSITSDEQISPRTATTDSLDSGPAAYLHWPGGRYGRCSDCERHKARRSSRRELERRVALDFAGVAPTVAHLIVAHGSPDSSWHAHSKGD